MDEQGASVEAPATGGYAVSAVARRIGVAPATLRTWDRRYGLSPSARTAGSHRRYTEADIALLERVQQMILRGMPPADAVRAARAPGEAGPPDTEELGQAPHAGGGNVIPLPRGTAQQRGLARAAGSLDGEAAAEILRRSISKRGAAWTWDQVVAPVMRGIGEKYAATAKGVGEVPAGIDVEHLLSHMVIREFARVSDVPRAVSPRPVLLASAVDDQHSLPLFALSAALAEQGIATRVLGARTPDVTLASAVRRLGPAAVFVWAQSPSQTDLRAAVPAIRPAPVVAVGGPGWVGKALPPGVVLCHDLMEALTVLGQAVRPAVDHR